MTFVGAADVIGVMCVHRTHSFDSVRDTSLPTNKEDVVDDGEEHKAVRLNQKDDDAMENDRFFFEFHSKAAN